MDIAWTRPALDHLDTIQDFVAQESPLAAFNLVVELFDRTQRQLGDNPQLGRPGRVRGTRELVHPHLPYIVVYRLTQRVEVLAVIHTARDWPEAFR